MDIASLLGMLGAFAIVLAAIFLGGSAGMFMNIPSLLIVIGGSLFVVLIKFPLGQFLGAISVAAKAFMFKMATVEELIDEVVELANLARKGGLLALESVEVSHPFMKKGVQMLVDGFDEAVVREMLEKDIRLSADRHGWGSKVFLAIGDVGPAMGMIGTLIGLVQMLANMSDPKSIGPAMAVALLTTLYGAMLATMVALPMADKLELRRDEEKRAKTLILDGLLAIQAGQNPRIIESLLRTYLPGKKQEAQEAAA
ncbi:flagellar motor protein PomA [Litorivicinus lipolyticus]|uniref:Flagellar motor protein PomA n=1 Tax=Litorivicinus lipolyticus TaxID=418701 RepID=A0A5Q2QAZ8_9GAMM|nr:flagellar motor protein PomA [Litorivicinus lipolyticus]QGG79432.1 flagellar motor protein PomA [Litorivicinus lipolyticus]